MVYIFHHLEFTFSGPNSHYVNNFASEQHGTSNPPTWPLQPMMSPAPGSSFGVSMDRYHPYRNILFTFEVARGLLMTSPYLAGKTHLQHVACSITTAGVGSEASTPNSYNAFSGIATQWLQQPEAGLPASNDALTYPPAVFQKVVELCKSTFEKDLLIKATLFNCSTAAHPSKVTKALMKNMAESWASTIMKAGLSSYSGYLLDLY